MLVVLNSYTSLINRWYANHKCVQVWFQIKTKQDESEIKSVQYLTTV